MKTYKLGLVELSVLWLEDKTKKFKQEGRLKELFKKSKASNRKILSCSKIDNEGNGSVFYEFDKTSDEIEYDRILQEYESLKKISRDCQRLIWIKNQKSKSLDHLKRQDLRNEIETLEDTVTTHFYTLDANTQNEFLNEVKTFIEDLNIVNPEHDNLDQALRKHFSFLLNRGHRNSPMMEEDKFDQLIEIFHYYFTNDFTSPDNFEVIKTTNVNKNRFLVELKNFYRAQLDTPEKFPESLAKLANFLTQDNWSEVTITTLQKASISNPY